MRDIEIVDQAIKKAQSNGWNEFHSQYARAFKQDGEILIEFLIGITDPPLVVSLDRVLFSSEFSIAFFGLDTWYFVVFNNQGHGMDESLVGWKSEKELENSDVRWEYYDNIPSNEYHLQQLAIETSQSSRIAYIEKFL